jgi:hypothetical protein
MAPPAPFEKGLRRVGIDVGGVLTVDTDTDVKRPRAGGAKGPGLAIAMQVRGPALSPAPRSNYRNADGTERSA